MDLETVIPGRISQMLITLRTTSSTKFQSAIHLYFMSQNGPIAKEWYLTRISIALAIKFVEHGLVSVVAHFKIHVLVEQLTTLPKLARLLVCVLTSKPQTVNFSWTSQEAIPKPIAPRPMNATRCGIGDSSTICSTVCSFVAVLPSVTGLATDTPIVLSQICIEAKWSPQYEPTIMIQDIWPCDAFLVHHTSNYRNETLNLPISVLLPSFFDVWNRLSSSTRSTLICYGVISSELWNLRRRP